MDNVSEGEQFVLLDIVLFCLQLLRIRFTKGPQWIWVTGEQASVVWTCKHFKLNLLLSPEFKCQNCSNFHKLTGLRELASPQLSSFGPQPLLEDWLKNWLPCCLIMQCGIIWWIRVWSFHLLCSFNYLYINRIFLSICCYCKDMFLSQLILPRDGN